MPLIGAAESVAIDGRRPAQWQVGPGFVAWQGVRAPQDDLGCRWYVTKDKGWRSPTTPKSDASDFAVGDGQQIGPVTFGSRLVELTGKVFAPDTDALLDAMDQFHALLTGVVRQAALSVTERGKSRSCRVVQGGQPLIDPTSPFEADWSLSLLAGDGRKLGPMATSLAVPPASQSGGLAYPVRYPVLYPAVNATGRVFLGNEGLIEAPLFARLTGPFTGASLTRLDRDGAVRVWATSMAVPAGQFVTVDMENLQMLAQGTTSRSGLVTSRNWFGVPAGGAQVAFATGDAGNTDARAQFFSPSGAW